MSAFLHSHSWYSLLAGVCSPATLVQRAARGGYTSLALTDTNNLYGAVAFSQLATQAGLRPLLGARLVHRGRQAVALVANGAGYRNLCRIISRVQLAAAAEAEAPAPDLVELLAAHAEGLHLLVDLPDTAEKLREPFRNRLWLEVVRPGPDANRLLDCARRLNLRLVASTAAYLSDAHDYHTLRLVRAVRQNTLLDRVPEVLDVSPQCRLVSAEQLRHRFRDLPEAIAGADDLAGLLRSDVLPHHLVLPRPKQTRDLDLTHYLRAWCERGLRDRGLGASFAARERLRKELAIIEDSELPGYFLTVREIARETRQRGHSMALRGSAGNSLVCYLLGITDVDPLRFGLELERFLHPGRVDLPDIDLDFDWKIRDEIIDYVIDRYGRDHVARISSHLFFQPRSAFRSAAKVHGLSGEQVSEMLTCLDARIDAIVLPDVAGHGGTPHELPVPPAPRGFALEAARWPRIVNDARRLLGRPTHLSLHPGGIVITPQAVDGYVPVQWAAKGVVMTQFDKDGVEAIGLVKIDLLGNRALSTVDEARLHARALVPTPAQCEDDAATLALLRAADTLGVTQLESPAMRHLLLQMRPTGLDDVIQSLALLRPGAASIGMKDLFIRRRHGLESPGDVHPIVARVLGETHGLMLYEDDSLRLIQALTGLPAAAADRFRKRISKHRSEEEAEQLRAEFFRLCGVITPRPNPLLVTAIPLCGIAGAERGDQRRGEVVSSSADRLAPPLPVGEGVRGWGDVPSLESIWQQLAKFNRYSFCKSHAVSYGLIAWQAVYLKAHHPLAFWTAALNNVQGAYSRWVYVEAIKRAGLTILPPCVNRSALPFGLEGDAIRTGLEAVAGLSDVLRSQIVRQRELHGPYRDLADLRQRTDVGPEALSTLIRAGALGFTGKNRPALALEARLPVPSAGNNELFTIDPTEGWSPPDDPPQRRWRDQWQTLGFVLGPTLFSLFAPASHAAARGRDKVGLPLVDSCDLPRHSGRLVRVAGLVATARNVVAEDGRPVQFVTLEDGLGLAEVTLFDGTCPQVPYLTLGPYLATGVVEDRFGACTLTAREFVSMKVTSSS